MRLELEVDRHSTHIGTTSSIVFCLRNHYWWRHVGKISAIAVNDRICARRAYVVDTVSVARTISGQELVAVGCACVVVLHNRTYVMSIAPNIGHNDVTEATCLRTLLRTG